MFSKGLTTREWLFLIVIVVGAQYLLHSVSERYGGSANALGYVSFAGTIVSILLGLIAIIYSFVQSISQVSSVAEIKRQVDVLMGAADNITTSKDMIQQSALKINEVTAALVDRVENNTKEFVGLRDSFSSFTAGKASHEEKSNSSSVFHSDREFICVACLATGEAVARGMDWDDMVEKIITPWCEQINYSPAEGASFFSAVLMVLETEQLLDIGEAGTIKPEAREGFNEKYKELKERISKLDEKTYVAYRDVIGKLA